MKKYLNPQDIIKMNLELQTVQRGLHKMGIYKPSFEVITSARFLQTFKLWESKKQDEFTLLISGGRGNQNKVKGLFK